ncbi:MAG TPA: signal peptidase II [Solirubrobacterales bacterium]|nr:signal peptidase II [Solirubrobacterales bacterium]
MSGSRAWRLAGALCGLVVILDQAAKALIEANLVPGQVVDVIGPLDLTLSHNSGVAFGLASGGGTRLVLVTVVALGVVGYLFSRDPARPGMWIAAGLLAGGALGNLADRIRADAVTDYIEIGSWPAFNLADVAVTLGVLLLAFSYMREPGGEAEQEDPG